MKSVLRDKRFCASIKSSFCIPEQGMVDFDVLCRASAFLFPPSNSAITSSSSIEEKWKIITSSHAVAPWRWPKYYPESWLSYVNQNYTKYELELKSLDGETICKIPLQNTSFHHPSRDAALLFFEDDENVLELIENGMEPLQLLLDTTLNSGDEIHYHGHNVVNVEEPGEMDDVESDNRKCVPRIERGHLHVRSKHQTFGISENILQLGMCGGPVLVHQYNQSSKESVMKCAGIVEGIVSTDYSDDNLRGNVVFLEANEIEKWIVQVNNGMVQPLIGKSANIEKDLDQ